MSNTTPIDVINYIKNAYLKYYDSAFWLKEEKLLNERRNLISQNGVLAQEVLLEAIFPYPSEVSVEQACSDAGLSSETAKYLGKIVFGEDFKLRSHQAQSLIASISKTSKKKKYTSQIKNYYIQATAYAVAHNYLFNTAINNFSIVIGVDEKESQCFTGKVVNFIPELKYRVRSFYSQQKGS